ncbi:hypothetical protein [Arthrobacter sp. YN]|uniref:hypothetical protein n=1 Tax=Arthrobacter sp. YN TaxID=2020486 RepID=UPI000B5F5482|nr:hypothetical protein [Arthrobacter sp. YN]ASN20121.1 hypothetical protein CGK93_10915 [Arthrobacter sp. YN]
MDRNEKSRLNNFIGEHLDVSRTRLKDWEVDFLVGFIENYDADYKGVSETLRTTETKGFDRSDTYRRRSTISYAFTDDIGIHEVDRVEYDDGQRDDFSVNITNARGVLEWFMKRRPHELQRYS